MLDARQGSSVGLPVIDMAPLFAEEAGSAAVGVARAIEMACRASGFFYVAGHGVEADLLERLEAASRAFFALPEAEKLEIAMSKGGAAWRGFFPVGGELTSGKPDIKEGLYFGSELPAEDPRVQAGWPLHGANLWPAQVPALRPAVTAYMTAARRAAEALLRGIAVSLDLPADYFALTYTANPTELFRIFHYPASASGSAQAAAPWGVGEHSDYGLLTLLAQDGSGGLQVKSPGGWIDAPPLPGTLVCNIGDMLDRLTGGWYRSTPHRVRNDAGVSRLSFPYFFDPDFAAEMVPLPEAAMIGKGREGAGQTPAEVRWDGKDLQAFKGSYGDYLMEKVSKVFPELGRRLL
jgi:isopenicillin N synthase-like dioxygenase